MNKTILMILMIVGCKNKNASYLIEKGLDFYIAKMANGDPVTLVVYGDSSVDGDQTSLWVKNRVDSKGNALGAYNHNITSPNSWLVILESMLREMFKNKNIHIYNAGYSGTTTLNN